MNIETTAKLNNLKLGPRKVRLVTDLIRGMRVPAAESQLMYMTKAAARPVLKLLRSAVANAIHNHGAIADTLVVKHTFVDGGAMQKRWSPRAMGRATPIRLRTSHITLILSGEGTGKSNEKKSTPAVVEAEGVEKKATKTPRVAKTSKAKKASK
jgi:large subunit ribosomal protein L22